MKNDIKNTFTILKYPLVNPEKEITQDDIKYYIDEHQKTFAKKYLENEQYFVGRNCAIVKTEVTDDEYNPNNKITVPYGKTMTQIVKGYMYKPSLITYTSEDEAYLEQLNEIFEKNKEQIKTSELGEDQSKFGIAFELLYSNTEIKDNLDEIEEDESITDTLPAFAKLKPYEVIPVYYRQLEPKLYCAIRYFIINDVDAKKEQEKDGVIKYSVEVFYKDRVDIYELIEGKNKDKDLIFKETKPHFFSEVPLAIYINNEEYQADYETVKTLIDCYDKLISSATNEEDRFSSAYLILKNYILSNSHDDNERKQTLDRIKKARVIEVQDNGEISFLTKDIPSAFMEFLRSLLREDIQFHSHIPDFRDKNFQSASGESMKWAMLDFENLCSDKQAYMEDGLRQLIKLINNFLEIKAIDASKVTIKFERNLPGNDSMQIDNVIKLQQLQLLPDEDLIQLLPKDMLKGTPEEILERMTKQKEKNIEMFDFENMKANGEEAVSGEVGEEKIEKKEEKTNGLENKGFKAGTK